VNEGTFDFKDALEPISWGAIEKRGTGPSLVSWYE